MGPNILYREKAHILAWKQEIIPTSEIPRHRDTAKFPNQTMFFFSLAYVIPLQNAGFGTLRKTSKMTDNLMKHEVLKYTS